MVEDGLARTEDNGNVEGLFGTEDGGSDVDVEMRFCDEGGVETDVVGVFVGNT